MQREKGLLRNRRDVQGVCLSRVDFICHGLFEFRRLDVLLSNASPLAGCVWPDDSLEDNRPFGECVAKCSTLGYRCVIYRVDGRDSDGATPISVVKGAWAESKQRRSEAKIGRETYQCLVITRRA